MAILQVSALFGGPGQMADTEYNRKRVFVMTSSVDGDRPIGNLGSKVNRSTISINLNNPYVAGAIAVSGYSTISFDSVDIFGDPNLASSISYLIEGLYIEVVDSTAPGVPLTRADLMAFVNTI